MIKQFTDEPVTTWEHDWQAPRKLIDIPKNCEGAPCGECHLQPGETCDICGRTLSVTSGVSDMTKNRKSK